MNITLLFSLARYEQVIDAYICRPRATPRGRRARSTRSRPSRPSSSHVDAKADPLLPAGSDLRGRVAIANAHRAYARYRERFADERWLTLHEAGARPQRPLWASTGTKDPSYSDVLYVEELIAPEVINTMPEATLRAFADHGNVGRALSVDAEAAAETLLRPTAPESTSVPSPAALEREGVRSFCDSYHELLHCIETKKARIATASGGPVVRSDR